MCGMNLVTKGSVLQELWDISCLNITCHSVESLAFSAASCVNFHSDPNLEPGLTGLISAYLLQLCLCNNYLEG